MLWKSILHFGLQNLASLLAAVKAASHQSHVLAAAFADFARRVGLRREEEGGEATYVSPVAVQH